MTINCDFTIFVSFFTTDEERFRSKCYSFHSTSRTWSNAQSKCQEKGMQMVSIETAEENDWIREINRDLYTGTCALVVCLFIQ